MTIIFGAFDSSAAMVGLSTMVMAVIGVICIFYYLTKNAGPVKAGDAEAAQKKSKLPPKDPADFTLTASSGEWHTEEFCGDCKAVTTHRERMAQICNTCGGFSTFGAYGEYNRSYRKIWNGTKWVWQYRYRNSRVGKLPENDRWEICEERYTGKGTD